MVSGLARVAVGMVILAVVIHSHEEAMPQVTELLELEPDLPPAAQLPADAIDQINQAQSVAQSAQQESKADAISAISAAMANTAAATKQSQEKLDQAQLEELAAIKQVKLANEKEEELKRKSETMDRAVAQSKKELNDVRIKHDQTKTDFEAAKVEYDAARDNAATAEAEAQRAEAEAARAKKLAESGNPMMLRAQKATQEANLKADEATQKAKNAADSAANAVQAAEEQSKTTTESSQLARKAQQAILASETEQGRASDMKQAESVTKHKLELQAAKTAELEEQTQVAQKADEKLEQKVLTWTVDPLLSKYLAAGDRCQAGGGKGDATSRDC